MENSNVNGLLVLPYDGDDDHDDHNKGIGSPHQSNNGDGFKVESPGGGSVSNLRRKGFGLKKWRRIKRDSPVKEVATPVDDDGSKILKRGLTGLVNPPSKHVDLSSVEAMQSSEGSVGSVNMVPNHHLHLHQAGVANGFSPDPGFMFTLGEAFEKSEVHRGAKNIGGKIVSGIQGEKLSDTIKKGSEERVIAQKDKPCSSVDSDLRSSGFVFSSGAVSVASNGEKDERLVMMNHIGEYSNEAQVREEVQNISRSENGGKEEDGDGESKKSNHYWEDKDQIADSIRNLAALQEALWKEVQSFQELGKESIPLHSNIDELSSPDRPRDAENCREENLTSSGSQAVVLKQKVKHLENKLEETKIILEAKESRIQELENSMIESELEGIFQRKIEAEIKHLMLTRSLKSLQAKPLTDDHEQNRGNILGKTCKLSFYFLTQLILIVSILGFLLLQFSPSSPLVIPT